MVSARARAMPPELFELGTHSRGLAGADLADARDASVVSRHPAALARLSSASVGVGVSALGLRLRRDGAAQSLKAARGLEVALAAPGTLFRLPFAVGVSLYLPQGQLASTQTLRATDSYWAMFQDRLHQMSAHVGVAVMPHPALSLGVSAATLSSTRGGFGVGGTAVLPSFGRDEYESELEHHVDADLTTIRYPLFSADLSLSEAWGVALAYRGEAAEESDIQGRLEGQLDATLTEIPIEYYLRSVTVTRFVPRQARLALRYQAQAWTFYAAAAWEGWGRYQSPISKTDAEINVEVPPGLQIDLPEAATASSPPAARFKNIVLPAIGVEHSLRLATGLRLQLGLGYGYHPSPVPAQSGETNFLDSDWHQLAAHLGSVIQASPSWPARQLRFGMALMTGVLEARQMGAAANGGPRVSGGLFGVALDAGLHF